MWSFDVHIMYLLVLIGTFRMNIMSWVKFKKLVKIKIIVIILLLLYLILFSKGKCSTLGRKTLSGD